MTRRRSQPEPADSGWPPSPERLEELVEEAIVDAYGEEEQRVLMIEPCRFCVTCRRWARARAAARRCCSGSRR
jgi:hypothetical protein